MMIAIDGQTKLAYEGQSYWGYGLWPTPVLSLATVIEGEDGFARLPPSSDLFNADIIFREDSFDPVTRIRRGRLYKNPGNQPQEWRVNPHFFLPSQATTNMRLHGYDSHFMTGLRDKLNGTLIALGTLDAYTLWRVVSIERIVTGEDLLTLRARSSLGVLPELNESAIPADSRAKVIETLGKLSEAAYRAGPESIVDRARDVAQWCIASWLADKEGEPKLRNIDLGQLVSKLPDKDYPVIRGVAGALARLHVRNKPNEQEKYNTRPVTEDDAEFSIAAIGLMLREIGWTRSSL